ncbi:MAG: hypothetical protein JOZ70_15960, partial [Pseudolabrys sp.]|nr:hypothetical protein [Pseudolabrys sp.]
MPVRDRLPWLVGGALAVALLLSPAIWNGYPLIFPDTGGYLARTFQGTLEFGRSALYGAFLRLGLPFDFWPNVIAQAALIAWLVYLTLRTHGLAHAVIFLLVAVMVLIDASSLPWYVGQLMPDILLPAAVLALHLLAFRRAALTRWERAGLVLVVAAAIASHMGTLALCLALIVILAVSMPLYRPWLRTGPPRLGLPAAAVIAGLILAPLSNLAITGQFAFTPGGESFLFGRLVQDGIVARYLKDKCPDPKIALCAHIERVPDSADE